MDPDTDGDLIGDACDPQMGPIDHLALFNGFYYPVTINGWTATSGTWTLYSNALHQDAPAPGDRMFAPPTLYNRIAVATSFVVGASGPNRAIGFCSGFVTGAQQYCCTVQDKSGGGQEVVSTSVYPTYANQTKVAWTGTFNVGDRIALVQNPANGNKCEATQGVVDVVATDSIGPSTAGKLEFFTSSTTAAYDYVHIVELAN